MGISGQPGEQVDHAVGEAAMAGVLDLGDILKLIVDRLDDSAFA